MCGATLAKLSQNGTRVGIIDLTGGEMGTRGTARQREREAAESARILGARFRETLDFGDGALRTGDAEVIALAERIREHRPRIVITSPRETRHPDHSKTARLVADASFLAGLRKFPAKGKPHRPDRVLYGMERYLFLPSFVVDVSKAWDTKMRALRAFESQFHRPGAKGAKGAQTFISRPEFLEEIEARGRFFGEQVGVRYGEPFLSDIPPKVDDLLGAFGGLEP